MVVILGGVMVKGGCPNRLCTDWPDGVKYGDIEVDETLGDYKAWFGRRRTDCDYQKAIRFCPWCGSPLTPPEEDGNEAE